LLEEAKGEPAWHPKFYSSQAHLKREIMELKCELKLLKNGAEKPVREGTEK
jgi:hypothetical protein